MANPREKISSVNPIQRKNQRFKTITLLSFLSLMFALYSSPPETLPEQRVQLRHVAPLKVIGTDYFRVALRGLQVLSQSYRFIFSLI